MSIDDAVWIMMIGGATFGRSLCYRQSGQSQFSYLSNKNMAQLPNLSSLKSFARWAIIVIAASVIAYSLFIMVIGVPGMMVIEVPEEGPMSPPVRTYTPFPLAFLPLLMALAIIVGKLIEKFWIVLISLLGMALFGFLTIFSAGFIYLLASFLLFIAIWMYQRTN
jgi:hypothetical protein